MIDDNTLTGADNTPAPPPPEDDIEYIPEVENNVVSFANGYVDTSNWNAAFETAVREELGISPSDMVIGFRLRSRCSKASLLATSSEVS